MNDKEVREQKKRVLRIVHRWIKPLWLGWWRLDFVWHREAFDDGEIMRCGSLWQYAEASIDVDLSQVALLDDDRLEQTVVHELMHPILNEARWGGEDILHEERVASWLQRAFMSVRAVGRKES